MVSATRRRARRAASSSSNRSKNANIDDDDDGGSGFVSVLLNSKLAPAISSAYKTLEKGLSRVGRWNIVRIVSVIAVLIVVVLQVVSDSEQTDLWTASDVPGEASVMSSMGDTQLMKQRLRTRRKHSQSVPVDPFIETDNAAVLEEARKLITSGVQFPKSTHDDNGTALAEILTGVILKYKVDTVVDLSCRDTFDIMLKLHPLLLSKHPDFVYKCVDSSVSHVRKMYHAVKQMSITNWFFYRREFSGADANALPRGDLVIAYDALQKHSLDSIADIFAAIRERGVEMVLLTTNPNRKNPLKGRHWKYSRMDFHAAPFNLKAPIHAFSEGFSLNASHPTMPKRVELIPLPAESLTSAIDAIREEI